MCLVAIDWGIINALQHCNKGPLPSSFLTFFAERAVLTTLPLCHGLTGGVTASGCIFLLCWLHIHLVRASRVARLVRSIGGMGGYVCMNVPFSKRRIGASSPSVRSVSGRGSEIGKCKGVAFSFGFASGSASKWWMMSTTSRDRELSAGALGWPLGLS